MGFWLLVGGACIVLAGGLVLWSKRFWHAPQLKELEDEIEVRPSLKPTTITRRQKP